ncbi:alpha/beta fold hydrolase [Pseudomonas sp. NPDC090208]|uniref:alpha/beta fold hydrolase n=2 Tax=unclassified Pseudomonas TaxID=196821 RepID=UPI00381EC0A0
MLNVDSAAEPNGQTLAESSMNRGFFERFKQRSRPLLAGLFLLTGALFAESGSAATQTSAVHYRSVQVDGLSIFYRESGPADAPTLLLLHGFPSSSRMYEPLLTRLSSQYHVIAPDYPGFGHSDAPAASTFAYTFDHLANVIEHFTDTLGLKHYALYMQDYGGPVGMRLAVAHPERVQAFIVQNAVSHEEGLGPLWAKRREFWANRAANEQSLRAVFLSLETTKQRHIGSNPHPELIDPDRWTDEYAFLTRPGEPDIQTDLFYDYRNNVASYPAWGAWLRAHQPRTLIIWGRYDPSFQVDEVAAFQRDVPKAETHILDAGHFALQDAPDEIAGLVSAFLHTLPTQAD